MRWPLLHLLHVAPLAIYSHPLYTGHLVPTSPADRAACSPPLWYSWYGNPSSNPHLSEQSVSW